MRYLLDTCVLSEMTKPRPASNVVSWLRGVDPEGVVVSVLTLGELEKGVRRLPSSKRQRALRTWLDEFREAYADRILPVTPEIATEWGELAAKSEGRGTSLPVVDALIAATALVHGLSVVTRNTSDIVRAGAETLDPWTLAPTRR